MEGKLSEGSQITLGFAFSILVILAGIIFSYGSLSERVKNIDNRMVRMEDKLDKLVEERSVVSLQQNNQ